MIEAIERLSALFGLFRRKPGYLMGNSSKSKAKLWPYTRHKTFEAALRRSNADWFRERGYAVNNHKPYILEKWQDWPRNIILKEVVEYIRAEQIRRNQAGERFPLHKYIHHGLSSQAMLFNLVGPLVASGNLQPFRQALEARGIPWPEGSNWATFELEDRKIFNEDTGQPTSIDLVISGHQGSRSLFIEAKLVEREFGGCSVFQGGDCDGSNPVKDLNACYLHFIGRKYWLLLEKHGFHSGLMATSPICPLGLYYQFFRELLFAIESGGDFVLLYDERNPSFYTPKSSGTRGLMPFLTGFVPEEMRIQVQSISIQQVVEKLRRDGRLELVREFESKYSLNQIADKTCTILLQEDI